MRNQAGICDRRQPSSFDRSPCLGKLAAQFRRKEAIRFNFHSTVPGAMDFGNLKDQVSNLTLYDIKAGVRKVQNGELPSIAPSQIYPSGIRIDSPIGFCLM